MGDISPLQHRFVLCDTLRKSLERKRYRGKWRSVRGIAEDNYALVQQGGFRLAAVPIRSRTSANLADHCTDTWQHVSKEPLLTEAVQYNSTAAEATRRQYPTTTLCVAHVDTVSAAVALGADTGILNFANAHCPGGRYSHGGRAQEEDLCRLLPELYPALKACEASMYPIPPDTALITYSVQAVRQVGTYAKCLSQGTYTVITAAMPCGVADRRPKGGWAESAWADTVLERIRSVLYAAAHAKCSNLVLGAFGCGAFGNPPAPVAALFRHELQSHQFRGLFACVVFAVLDPLGTYSSTFSLGVRPWPFVLVQLLASKVTPTLLRDSYSSSCVCLVHADLFCTRPCVRTLSLVQPGTGNLAPFRRELGVQSKWNHTTAHVPAPVSSSVQYTNACCK
eukprot:m.921626 g.921626  ORF g.921626 m.921626 type:complete len:395 (-) comp23757_c0_seq36:2977-4161(-)